jgi:putative hydrolase of the HAD superfamily
VRRSGVLRWGTRGRGGDNVGATVPAVRQLLFDFGGPMLLSPFELAEQAAASMHVDPSAFGRGPFDRAADEAWMARERGEITERDYWTQEAARFGLDIVGYMHHFYDPPGDHLVRPGAEALLDDAVAAGRRVGLLTNDLTAFHGPGWHDEVHVLKKFDPLIDLSSTGYLKPSPRAYEVAIDAMGVPAEDIVFLDDHHDNVDGAAAAGMVAIWFDLTDPLGSLARTRAALDLPVPDRPGGSTP